MKILLALLATSLLLMAHVALADSRDFDGRTIHYSLSPTTYLTPEVAAAYRIQRSATRNLVTIAILDGSAPDAPPLAATLEGEARNLLGQIQPLRFQEVREGNAIYYIATIDFSSEEMWRFAIDITLSDGNSTRLAFDKTLYAD